MASRTRASSLLGMSAFVPAACCLLPRAAHTGLSDARLCRAETETADCAQLHLRVALSYGGRQDIAAAARRLAAAAAAGELRPEDIDEDAFERALHAQRPGMAAPDLLIRCVAVSVSGFDFRLHMS